MALAGEVSVAIDGNLLPFERDLARARAIAQRFEASAARNMAGVTRSMSGATAGAARMTRSLQSAQTATIGLAGSLGGLGTAIAGALSIRAINEFANAWTRVTRSLEAGERVFGVTLTNAARLNALANEARVDLDAYTKLYIRTTAAIRDYGMSSSVAEQVTSTLAKALKLGGAAASEQASVILQFSQALQKGKLDGDEFRSVMENAGVVQELLAKRLNVTKGEIVSLAAEGKLKLTDLVGAMTEGAAQVDRIFKEMPVTVDEATTVMVNRTRQYIGTLDAQVGATRVAGQAIVGLSNNLDVLAGVVGGAATLALIKATAATNGLTAALLRNPFGLIGIGLSAAIGAAITFRNETVEIGGATIRVGNVLVAAWTTVAEAIGTANQALGDYTEAAQRIARMDVSQGVAAGVTAGAAAAGAAVGDAEQRIGAISGAVERIRAAWADISAASPLASPFSFGEAAGPFMPNQVRAKPSPTGDVEQYEKRVAAIKRQVDAMKIEAATYGMSEAAAAQFRITKELENAAAAAGITLTRDRKEANDLLAVSYGDLTARLEGLRLLEEFKGPADIFNDQVNRLKELYDRDVLNFEQYQGLKARAEADRLAGAAQALQAEVAMIGRTAELSIGFYEAVAGKSKASAIAAIAVNKAVGIANVLISTAQAAAAALAPPPFGLGPIAGAGLAARTWAYGGAQAALIAGTGIAEAVTRGSGPATPAAPSIPSSAGSAAAAPGLPAANTAPQQHITINVQGQSLSREQFREIIEGINDLQRDGGPRFAVQYV